MRRSRKMRVARKKKTTTKSLVKMVRQMRPEVKSTQKIFYANAHLIKSTGTGLDPDDYEYLFVYPSQGTQDYQRIGDHIRLKKIWFKFWIVGNTVLDSFTYRVIIWSPSDGLYTPGITTVLGFWKWANSSQTTPTLQNMVNRTHIKVHYDKQFTYNSIFESGTNANVQKGRFHSINLRPRRENVTFNTGTAPKYAQNTYYITIIAGTFQGNDRDILLNWMGQSLIYYTDN